MKKDDIKQIDFQGDPTGAGGLVVATQYGTGGGTLRDHTHTVSGDGGVLLAGTATGDFIRFNAVSDRWEVAVEPIALKGFVLTPALASLIDAEGAIYYNSATKAVMVCTDI